MEAVAAHEGADRVSHLSGIRQRAAADGTLFISRQLRDHTKLLLRQSSCFELDDLRELLLGKQHRLRALDHRNPRRQHIGAAFDLVRGDLELLNV